MTVDTADGATATAASAADTGMDVDTDLVPTTTAPPTTQHISSFLLHIRWRAAHMAVDPALGAATPVDTVDNTSRGHTQNDTSISGPGDDDVAGGNVAVATAITADEPGVTADSAVDTDGGDAAPPAEMNIGNTNNPVGLDGDIAMGPGDGILVINSDTAASPTLKTTDGPEPPQLPLPTERTTLHNGDDNGHEHSATVTRGHANENTAQRKWLVVRRYMIKRASPNKTPTHLNMAG